MSIFTHYGLVENSAQAAEQGGREAGRASIEAGKIMPGKRVASVAKLFLYLIPASHPTPPPPPPQDVTFGPKWTRCVYEAQVTFLLLAYLHHLPHFPFLFHHHHHLLCVLPVHPSLVAFHLILSCYHHLCYIHLSLVPLSFSVLLSLHSYPIFFPAITTCSISHLLVVVTISYLTSHFLFCHH